MSAPGDGTFRTACTLDCPDTCTLAVTVLDGCIVDIAASSDVDANPATTDFICRKVQRSTRRIHSPERIMTPLVRVGPKGEGRFRECGWEEALDMIASRVADAISSHGPDAVIPYIYNSSAGVLESQGSTVELFARLGCPEVDHTICAKTYGQAWEQVYPGMHSADPMSLPTSRLVVLWGANSTVSNTHLPPLLQQCRDNGGAVVVVDPRRTGVAVRADLHLQIVPGTDAILAMAVAAEIDRAGHLDHDFISSHVDRAAEYLAECRRWSLSEAAKECGVTESDIVRFAELVGTTRPSMLRMGWGVERNRNGGSGMLAVFSLWALAGHFGEEGSGIIGSTSSAAEAVFDVPLPEVASARRVLNMNHVGRLMRGDLEGWSVPDVLFVQGANPAVTAVDQMGMLEGLSSEEVFTVVHDQVLTDTARFADVVLPATTQFEVDDVATSYGSFVLQRVRPMIEPVGESRGNDWLGRQLAMRLGVEIRTPRAADLLASEIVDTRRPGQSVQFRDSFPRGGKARLCVDGSELAMPRPQKGRADLGDGLRLLTSATARTVNSMFAEYDPPEAAVSMNPDDAAARSIDDGDLVTVWNDRGSVTLPAKVGTTMRTGVCEIPKGLWMKHTSTGAVSNALVGDELNDLGGGACFNEAVVRIRKADR